VSTVESSDILSPTIRHEGHLRRFQRGQALFTEGDLAQRVFLIERSWMTVTCTTAGGREIMLALRGPEDMLGELSALDGEPRLTTATAVSDVDATVVSGSTLSRTVDDAQAHAS
jgi:CRP/FNR family transcriptional regulator, cyclic AMP receptor protein